MLLREHSECNAQQLFNRLVRAIAPVPVNRTAPVFPRQQSQSIDNAVAHRCTTLGCRGVRTDLARGYQRDGADTPFTVIAWSTKTAVHVRRGSLGFWPLGQPASFISHRPPALLEVDRETSEQVPTQRIVDLREGVAVAEASRNNLLTS